MKLEILSHQPTKSERPQSVLFVHGAFAGAWVWDEHFLPYFAEQGYAAHAISLRGHGGSGGRDRIHDHSLRDYVCDVREVVDELGTSPVLVGHSLGGTVVQKFLEGAKAPAAVLMGTAPPQGLWPMSVSMAFRNPVLFHQLGLMQTFGIGLGNPDLVRRALFANHVPQDKLISYARRLQMESWRIPVDLLWPVVQIEQVKSTPLLVLGAQQDPFVSPALVKLTALTYGAEAEVFPDMSHAMMLEQDWQRVADKILSWLEVAVLTKVPELAAQD